MEQVDLAYAAGIIDGEGSIKIFKIKADYLKRKTDRYQLQVQVDMVDPKAVTWLQQMFGGKLYDHKRKPETNWRDSKRWYIVTQQAGKFLEKILPYMKVKSIHARLAIDFLKLPPKHPDKHLFWERNKELNRIGRR